MVHLPLDLMIHLPLDLMVHLLLDLLPYLLDLVAYLLLDLVVYLLLDLVVYLLLDQVMHPLDQVPARFHLWDSQAADRLVSPQDALLNRLFLWTDLRTRFHLR